MRIPGRIALCTLILMLVALPAALHGQSLTAARDLYAAAEYEQALLMLDSLSNADPSQHTELSVVRALCLFALKRPEAAEHTLEAMLLTDPLYRPSAEELPPRVRNVISGIRRRILPSAVQRMYADAKAAFDRKEFPEAAGGFRKVIDALKNEDLAPLDANPALLDVKTLAAGFLDLSIAAATPPPTPPPPPPAAVVAPPLPPRVYSAEDAGIVAPQAIRQEMPIYRGPVKVARTGVIEVVINERGEVESAIMRTTVDPLFDPQVVDAARSWRYQPATREGAPVKFLKRIQVNLVPRF